MDKYILRAKAIVLTIHLDHTVLVYETGVSEQLSKAHHKSATCKFHQENTVARIDDEVAAEDRPIDDCGLHLD